MKRVIGLILGTFLLFSCQSDEGLPEPTPRDYREEMRRLVIHISRYARSERPGFIIVPQNGQELILDGDGAYMDAVDGTGREDLNYGYTGDNRPTPDRERGYLLSLCRRFAEEGKTVLVTDYCRDGEKADRAYAANREEGFLSFAAPERDLSVIPPYPSAPRGSSDRDITGLAEASNFLYLINDAGYSGRDDFLSDAVNTDYDVLILDLFFQEEPWTADEIKTLKEKKRGGSRLVLAYMSIGEAEDYRWYWRDRWEKERPAWLESENPHWEGNYKVRYWEEGWRCILTGSPDAYLDRILAAGFDGAYLDIIDGFEYFENL